METIKLERIPLDEALLRLIRHHPEGVSTVTIHIAFGIWTSLGSIYVALDDLEARGLIRFYETPGGPERGGRPARIVVATPAPQSAE